MSLIYKHILKKLFVFALSSLFSVSTYGLTALSEDEMEDLSGQASLLSIDKYDYGVNNFYQVKINSKIRTSLNIDSLVLKDSSGNPQIDIDNISLNGGYRGDRKIIYDKTLGEFNWGSANNGVSSGTLTNPYIEFAFKGNIDQQSNAARKEIIGIRVGADEIAGHISFGNREAVTAADNASSVNDGGAIAANSGINKFRGYINTKPVYAQFNTLNSRGKFNKTMPNPDSEPSGRTGPVGNEFRITGAACDELAWGDCGFITNFVLPNARLFFPSVTTKRQLVVKNGIVINTSDGVPISSFSVVTDVADIPDIPVIITGKTEPLLGIVTVTLEATATMTELDVQATFNEDLRFLHNAKFTHTVGGNNGFSLSAQKKDILWRNDAVEAKAGWWLSINNAVELGTLNPAIPIEDSVLKQLTDQASIYLSEWDNEGVPVKVCIFCALWQKTLYPVVGDVPIDNLLETTVKNVDLGIVQNEIRNCWNGLLGC